MSDKERLEQIQQNDLIQAISDGFLFGKDGLKTENIFRDVEWLIKQAERVEELELEINDWREEVQKWQQFYKESEESHLETKELLKSIANQNKRLREALEFYASGNHYLVYYDKIILSDDGEKARKALEG